MATRSASLLTPVEVGHRFMIVRTHARKTQIDLGLELGYPVKSASSAISRFESGKRGLPAEKLRQALQNLAGEGDLTRDWETLEAYVAGEIHDFAACVRRTEPQGGDVLPLTKNNAIPADRARSVSLKVA